MSKGGSGDDNDSVVERGNAQLDALSRVITSLEENVETAAATSGSITQKARSELQ